MLFLIKPSNLSMYLYPFIDSVINYASLASMFYTRLTVCALFEPAYEMFAFIAFASKEESDKPGQMCSLTRAFVVQAHKPILWDIGKQCRPRSDAAECGV